MKDASLENEIIRRWRAGQAQRRIARELGINRKRVGRVVREHRQARDSGGVHPDLPAPRKSRLGRKLITVEPVLRDLLGCDALRSLERILAVQASPKRPWTAGEQGAPPLQPDLPPGETIPPRDSREYPEASSLLFKIIDRRNGHGSTALVTNVAFEEWTEYLGDPPLAMALWDRIVDGALMHKFKGKSYRAHRAKRDRLAPTAAPRDA